MIMGISFAYVPSMQAIAGQYDVGTILGAQIIGGIVAVIVGLTVKKSVSCSRLLLPEPWYLLLVFPCIPQR